LSRLLPLCRLDFRFEPHIRGFGQEAAEQPAGQPAREYSSQQVDRFIHGRQA
jgi:hypothetical protein